MITDQRTRPASSSSTRETSVISRRIQHPSWTEWQVTLQGSGHSSFRLEQLEAFLNASGTATLNTDFFGLDQRMASLSGERRREGIAESETTLLLPDYDGGGVQIGKLSGGRSTPIFDRDRIIGRYFEDSDAKYCWLGGVLPWDPAASREVQTQQVLEIIRKSLAQAGMHFRDIVRTWFYNDRILDWYDVFNRVRTAFFKQHSIVCLPASTGIGAPNSAGAALVAKVFAVLPRTRNVAVTPVRSPLQCEASTYGSSFSRAMEVRDASGRTLYISGTASIAPAGKTAHVGNTAKQIETTMEVIGALFEEADMVLSDTTRAIAYFRHAGDIALWHDYCRRKQLPALPIILIPAYVCRDDLLFEIELDASRPNDAANRLEI